MTFRHYVASRPQGNDPRGQTVRMILGDDDAEFSDQSEFERWRTDVPDALRREADLLWNEYRVFVLGEPPLRRGRS